MCVIWRHRWLHRACRWSSWTWRRDDKRRRDSLLSTAGLHQTIACRTASHVHLPVLSIDELIALLDAHAVLLCRAWYGAHEPAAVQQQLTDTCNYIEVDMRRSACSTFLQFCAIFDLSQNLTSYQIIFSPHSEALKAKRAYPSETYLVTTSPRGFVFQICHSINNTFGDRNCGILIKAALLLFVITHCLRRDINTACL